MNTDQIADKITGLVEFRILQLLPKPTCPTKQADHRKLTDQVRKKVAHKLWPISGVQINITP